jgi:hypothetical protein
MVKCVPLALATPWQRNYFGHAFNKACEYALNGTNVYVDFHEVKYLKATRSSLQKIITWTKELGKGQNEWENACHDVSISH